MVVIFCQFLPLALLSGFKFLQQISVFLMARSSGLILQICDVIALLFHGKHRKFGLVKGHILLAWSTLHAMAIGLEKQWLVLKIGSSSGTSSRQFL